MGWRRRSPWPESNNPAIAATSVADADVKLAHFMHNGRACAVLLWHCESFFERAAGLLAQNEPLDSQVLHIPHCSAVHTIGLRYPIDIVFTDANGRVLRCVRRLPPWRLAFQRGAQSALEMRAGLSSVLGIEIGSRVGQARFQPILTPRINWAARQAPDSILGHRSRASGRRSA